MSKSGTPRAADAAPEGEVEEGHVLVDSSLWVDYYQPGGCSEVQEAVQEALSLWRVATSAMIVIEVQPGALTEESFASIGDDLEALHWLGATPDVASRGAAIGFALEGGGSRVPATDLLIAATAIEHGCTLWHDDGHFETIAAHSDLKQRRFQRGWPAAEPPAP